ncbi:head-tail connector protein [Falsirhodobacter sp. 1013]|uniref:head-tail connector protein n=1 Tax=Falsirhodobacter sp. 1013 TaxID=3417566 RepID=UPI003EB9675E
MNLIEERPVAAQALPIAALKEHLRLGTGFADDGLQDRLVESHLRAALAAVEGRIGKALIARSFRLVLNRWRDGVSQALPLAPVLSVQALRVGGAEVAPAAWWLAQDMHRPRLVGRSGLPAIPEGKTAEIVFTAGFGAWDAVPADLTQAVMLLAAEYYEVRHEAGLRVSALPMQVATLIERWRIVRVSGGAICG